MKVNSAIYQEPIFFQNGNISGFLDGKAISVKGISVKELKKNLPFSGVIEFSFPDTEKVIKAIYEIDADSEIYYLKFTKIITLDGLKLIETFVKKFEG